MKQFISFWRSLLVSFLLVLSLTVIPTNTALAAVNCADGDDYEDTKLYPAEETLFKQGCKLYCDTVRIGSGFFSFPVVKDLNIQCDGLTFSNVDFSGVDFFSKKYGYNYEDFEHYRPYIKSLSFKNTHFDSQTDFAGANLSGVNLSGANLSHADLTNANLSHADLSHANLSHARFAEAGLENADLSHANLSHADLGAAHLTNAHLKETSLTDAYLTNADLTDADLTDAHLTDADLTGANLNRAKISGAHLEQASSLKGAKLINLNLIGWQPEKPPNLDNTILAGTNLTGAHLQGASLQGATLERYDMKWIGEGDPAILLHANLEGANLNNAHLNGVDFSNTNLANAKFQKVELDDTTFLNAILSGVDFSGATLQGIEFYGATLNNATFKNATITRTQNTGTDTNFTCSYLGGADFSDATVHSSNFEDAVVTSASNCRSDSSNSTGYFCGTDPFTQTAYGTTKFDNFDNSVICPDGHRGQCNSHLNFTNWTTSDCGSPNIRWFPTNQPTSQNTVNIPDPNLKQCIARQMYQNSSADIDKTRAESVRAISCPGEGISNASGIDSFTGLESLDLSNNSLNGNLTLLQNEDLVHLNLENNQLTTLTLNADAEPYELNLAHNKLSEFDLTGEHELIFADLSHNNLTSVGDVSGDTNLVELFLDHNNLKHIGDVSNLVDGKLSELSLQDNPSFKCSSLKLSTDDLEDTGCGQS